MAIVISGMSWILNSLYAVALLAALPWLAWRRYHSGRYRAGWRHKLLGLRRGEFHKRRPGPVIWVHGVSVGEIQLLQPLVVQWQREQPDYQFAISSTTDSGMQLARKLFSSDVWLFYFPLDFSWAVQRTLAVLQPSLLVLGELELWPNLIAACRRRKVPVAVVNGRLSPRSWAGYQRLGKLTRGMFESVSLIAAQSESNAERFRSCGAQDTTFVTGSIKFDNVAFDRHAAEVDRLRRLVGLGATDRVWVMGSTQAGEELPAIEAFWRLRSDFPSLKLILVPRHPDRFAEVAELLQRSGLRWLRRSEIQQPVEGAAWEVLLVDTVGELKWWWGLAEIAIVGGSFGARGGQNMLEPAAYGANTAFGPQTTNFRDIVELLLAGDASTRLHKLEEIESWVRQELRDPEPGQARGARARQIIAQGQGALQRTLDALQQLLQASRGSNRWATDLEVRRTEFQQLPQESPSSDGYSAGDR